MRLFRRRDRAGEFSHCGGGETSRSRRRFDAPGVQPTVGPVSCDDEVVEAGISWPDAVLNGAGEGRHLEDRWSDLGSTVLVVQTRRPVRRACRRSVAEQLPTETLCTSGARPQHADMAVEELA